MKNRTFLSTIPRSPRFFAATLFLLAFAAAKYPDKQDAGVGASHPRHSSASSPRENEGGGMPRRILSEAAWARRRKDQERANADERPSGVAHRYTPPPPINLTARSLLSSQFPKLADINKNATSAALCGIVKDAERYLDEWVNYHVGLGFHTVYLIDNSDDHELLDWQNKRRGAGYSVRVMPRPGRDMQTHGYHMCASEHGDDHAYMAFLDVDEFLVLKKHDTIDDMLRDHLRGGALAISWYIFGTGGRTAYAPLPVTKRFLFRDGVSRDDRHKGNWHRVKTILKLSDYGGHPQNPHSMKTNGRTAGSDKAWVDTNGKGNFGKNGTSNFARPVDVAVIHHYRYLSPKEFHWKSCVRKTVDNKVGLRVGASVGPPADCEGGTGGLDLYEGKIFDDSAWRALKANVPRYAAFDMFEDFL